MKQIANRRAELIGLGGRLLICHLRIWKESIDHDQAPCYVVVMTELPDNPGASVTNASELIASQVCSLYRIEPETAVWYEHYPAIKRGRQRERETFDRVNFTTLATPRWPGMGYGDLYLRVSDPCWLASSREALEMLIGQSFEPIEEDVPQFRGYED